MNRRELLLSAAAIAVPASLARSEPVKPAREGALRILILGGTGFIGPHFVREALAHCHAVTLFNRGKSQAQPTPGVETLLGDRDGVVIIPAEIAAEVVTKTEEVVATESDMRRALVSGMDPVEAYLKFGKF